MDFQDKNFSKICNDCELSAVGRSLLRAGFGAFEGTIRPAKTKEEIAERNKVVEAFWEKVDAARESDKFNLENFIVAASMCTDISHKQMESQRVTAAKVRDREDEFVIFSNMTDSCLEYYKDRTGEKFDLSLLETGTYPER